MDKVREIKNKLYRCGILAKADTQQTKYVAKKLDDLCKGGISAVVLQAVPELEELICSIRSQRTDYFIVADCRQNSLTPKMLTADCCLCPAKKVSNMGCECPLIPVYTSVKELMYSAPSEDALVYLDCTVSLAKLYELQKIFPKLFFLLNSNGELDSKLLLHPNVLALLNPYILDKEPDITTRANEEMYRILEIGSGHLGINAQNYEDASRLMQRLTILLGQPAFETWRSFLIGNLIEIMHYPYRGQNGHFGILCNNLARTMQYFRTRGVQFDMTTYEDNAIVYFCGDYGGFEIHLTQRKSKKSLSPPPL